MTLIHKKSGYKITIKAKDITLNVLGYIVIQLIALVEIFYLITK